MRVWGVRMDVIPEDELPKEPGQDDLERVARASADRLFLGVRHVYSVRLSGRKPRTIDYLVKADGYR